MTDIVFASANPHKVEEIGRKLGGVIRVRGLADIGCTVELPETGNTLQANARQKAHYVWEHFRVNCFADDTGLEVDALDGRPGVDSAFYAGPQKSFSDNVRKLLEDLDGTVYRTARFRTVICLVIGGEEYLFEGVVEGHIAREQRGSGGFGYDPVFVPEGNSRCFAEMSLEEKNLLSHRGRAVEALRRFLHHR